MEYILIYLIQISNYLVISSTITGVLSLMFLLALFFAYDTIKEGYIDSIKYPYCDKGKGKFIKRINAPFIDLYKKGFVVCLTITLILLIMPTKQTLILMGGTYFGKKAVHQIVTSEKLEKVNTIIDLHLDKYIKKLQGATK